VAVLRQWAGTDRTGTTALGLVQAGERAGLALRGVRADPAEIDRMPLPAVAHLLLPSRNPHYVVLERVDRDRVRVMDPAVGKPSSWPRKRFAGEATGVFLLAAPAAGGEAGETGGEGAPAAWLRLWRLLRPHRGALGQALLAATASTVLGFATAVYVQMLLDTVLPNEDRGLLLLLGLGMAVTAGLRLALGWFQGRLTLRVAQRIDASLLLGYYRHLLRLPRAFHDGMRVGELVSRVGDAVKIRQFLATTAVSLVVNPVLVVGSLAALLAHDARLGLLAAGLVAVHLVTHPLAGRWTRERQRETMRRAAEWQSHLTESLGVQATVRALGLEEREGRRMEQHLVRLLRATRRAAVLQLGVGTFAQGTTQAYTLATLWLGAGLVLGRGLSAGELMAAYTLAGYLSGPVAALAGLNAAVQDALVATERLYEIVDLETEAPGGGLGLSETTAGEVRVEGLCLQHPGRLPVLEGVDLVFGEGRLTVLAGPPGSGKSSVLAALQGAFPVAKGAIRIGGRDLDHFERASLRRGMAVVPQRVELFTGTIAENLVPGEDEPDLERLLGACRDAGALGWIEAQPGKFGAWLAEAGANLSGGQRQRLALARAFYRASPILLLDEPTSALDAEAEAGVIAALRRRTASGVTVIVASHAPALQRAADAVYRLEGGRVVSGPARPAGAEERAG
jgi:ATP-binding cassette, subfamily C, bacteriocin exporter